MTERSRRNSAASASAAQSIPCGATQSASQAVLRASASCASLIAEQGQAVFGKERGHDASLAQSVHCRAESPQRLKRFAEREKQSAAQKGASSAASQDSNHLVQGDLGVL